MDKMLTLRHLSRFGRLSMPQARFFSQAPPQCDRIENIFIIGTDLMAREFAQSCALAGKFNSIVMSDPELSNQELADVHMSIAANLTKMAQKRKIRMDESVAEIRNRITLAPECFPNQDRNLLVIESLGQNLELKQRVLKDLSEYFKANTSALIVSDNSNWRIDKIGKHIKHKERYAGLRFFSPMEDSVKTSEFIILLTLCLGFKTMIYPDLFASLDRTYKRIEQDPIVKWKFKLTNETLMKKIDISNFKIPLFYRELLHFKDAILNTQNKSTLNCALQLFNSNLQVPNSKLFEAKTAFSDFNSTYNSITNKAKRQFSRFFPESTIKITCTEDTANATLKLLRQFANDIDKECIVERD